MARAAFRDHAWREAFDLFSAADAVRRLDAEDLLCLAVAAYWNGRLETSLGVMERAYVAYLDRGDDCSAALVSIGGVQSNHTRQVAAVAARLGLRCALVQEHWVDWPDAVYEKVGNILLSRIMGAEVRLDPAGFDIGFRESWEQALASVEERGCRPYAIPAGASDHPLGGLGFARWAREVQAQERELGVFFDTIVVCSVTGSTQAGMIAGFADEAQRRRVLGIDGSATVAQTWEQVARIALRTAEAIGVERFWLGSICWEPRYSRLDSSAR